MRSAFPLLFTACIFTGCVATAPPPAAPVPPVVRVETPTPAPQPVRVEPEVVEAPPATPPPVEKRRIARRSLFETDRVAEWALDNGLTVLYAWDDGVSGYALRISAPRPGTDAGPLQIGVGRGATTATGDRLEPLVEAAARQLARDGVGRTVVLLHGALGPEWVEPLVASVLGAVPGAPGVAPASVPLGSVVAADWGDLPALAVAAEALGRRATGGAPAVVYDPASSRARLTVRRPLTAEPEADALRDARAAAARALRQPDGVLLALDALYQLDGRYRPARPVSAARDLADRTDRVPLAAVGAVLARLTAAAR